MAENKEHLSLVVCGHVDAGKSTTCGHLIFKQGGIPEREMVKLNELAAEKGKSSFGFAYYLDTCKEERDRGVTIQCNTKEFFTKNYHYTIVDAPGHKDYIKNMITGSATADVGMLLVPAEKGGFEAAIAKADAKLGVDEGQTRQHARLLYLLGVEQIIVGINKMDSCGWSQDRFNEIKEEFVKMLQMIGYKPKKVPFIPYSGFKGDNLVDPVDAGTCSWYKGWSANRTPKKVITGMTIVDALDNYITPPKREPDAPLRLPVSSIYNIKGIGQIICGTVEQGTLRAGDPVGFVPSNLKGKKIFSIEQHCKSLEVAGPGNSVGLSVKGIAKDEKVSPGDIIYNEKDGELKPIKTFTALVAVQEHPGILKAGYCPVIFSRTAKVACKMTKILWKMGKKTGGVKVDNPTELSQFENAEVEFEPTAPLFVEPFAQCAALGRFAVMDSNRLKMLGKVSAVVNKD
jgi:elongation factor 1-alpha|mmetsp:Transcript_7562/g.16326  ORF Transcript_7562/g.16326 Transcript_7562/m.16326 type:complete len:458 (+) Transcript_7562:139-1512(+)